MAWKIHSWSSRNRSGFISSPHYGPWPFGDSANSAGTADFQVGEEVVAEVEGIREGKPVVQDVRRIRSRLAPPGTYCAKFDEVNRKSDFEISEHTAERVTFLLYDCCQWCDPGIRVVFSGVVTAKGLESEDFDEPWFRFATDEELRAQEAVVPDGFAAYALVLGPSSEGEPQPALIVARNVTVTAQSRPD